MEISKLGCFLSCCVNVVKHAVPEVPLELRSPRYPIKGLHHSPVPLLLQIKVSCANTSPNTPSLHWQQGWKEVPNRPYFTGNTSRFVLLWTSPMLHTVMWSRPSKSRGLWQVLVTWVRFVTLLINAWLKMAPADNCKQAEVRTSCWLARYADEVFRCFVSLSRRWEMTHQSGKKTLAAFGGIVKHDPEKTFQCSPGLCCTLDSNTTS